MTAAETIRQQLGGSKFTAMTGARDFVNTGCGLQFRLPRIAGCRVRYVRIELTPADLYNVKFYDTNVRELATAEGVYADQLRATFTEQTGLATSL